MANKFYKRAAGLFYSHDEAEAAIRALKDDGYDMDNISLLARNPDGISGAEEVADTEGNNAAEGAGAGATTGAVIGGIGGLLLGAGVLAIPGLGPVLAAGAGISEIAATLAGAGIGAAAGGLVGALTGLGIPEEKAKVYDERVRGGSFLVIVNGTAAEIARAESIMQQHGVEEFGIYDVPGAQPTTVADVDEDLRTRTDITDNEKIKLHEERLMVNKQRAKTGDVSVGKRVETETAKVSVPVEKERLVIERRDATSGTVVAPGTADFDGGKVARVDLYEETANVEKQAFVREEVSVRKEVEQETVQASETIRREELEVNADGDVLER
ncbi:MAG: YsnF/AvaK domain-containing protein [Cyanophyceae cyanobacterium]